MKQDGLSYFTHPELALIALVLFFFAFIALMIKVYFIDPKSKYTKLGQIPLEETERGHHGQE